MGKKSKKPTKGKGAEKTARKTEKNMNKKSKKDGCDMDDLEEFLEKLKEEDRRKATITVEVCDPPKPRVNFSFTANSEKGEIYLFGGECAEGNKTYLYNDLFSYDCKENVWYKIVSPNAPLPRCSHQAVFYKPPSAEGELWLFGGEYASPTQTQFYHYRDLHKYHVNSKKWELVSNRCGPLARSGHRMLLWKKSLIVLGGFQDTGRYSKYFNDLWMFDMESRQWNELKATVGACAGPSPRSGFVFLHHPDFRHMYVLGGFSKEKVRKDVEKPIVHSDAYQLTIARSTEESASTSSGRRPNTSNASTAAAWTVKWIQLKPCGPDRPPFPRSGMTGVQFGSGPRALLFGGVTDREEDEETLLSEFHDDLFHVELDKARWTKLPMQEGVLDGGGNEEMEEEELKMEGIEGDTEPPGNDPTNKLTTVNPHDCWPSPRINCGLAFVQKKLYLFGGLCETSNDRDSDMEESDEDDDDDDDADKQITMNDFYCAEIGKSSHAPWCCLFPGTHKSSVNVANEAATTSKSMKTTSQIMGDNKSEEPMDTATSRVVLVTALQTQAEGKEVEAEGKEVNVPAIVAGELFADYWTRTQQRWKETIEMELDDNSDDEAMSSEEEEDQDVEEAIPDEILLKYAKETALKYFRKNVKN